MYGANKTDERRLSRAGHCCPGGLLLGQWRTLRLLEMAGINHGRGQAVAVTKRLPQIQHEGLLTLHQAARLKHLTPKGRGVERLPQKWLSPLLR